MPLPKQTPTTAVPAPAKRRSRRRTQDSLRPGWMLNSILFCVLLASIGACYVWLVAKKKNLADQILGMHTEIRQFDQLIKEKEMHISSRLAPEGLRIRTSRAGLELKPIDINSRNRLVRLPDPVIAQKPPALSFSSPVLAGNRLP